MATDIKLSLGEPLHGETQGEILLGVDDFLFVHNDECLKQDIFTLLHSAPTSLFYDPKYGSSFLKLIHAPLNKQTLASFEQEIKLALMSDPRIDSNSITISINAIDNYPKIDISFISLLSEEPISLSYTLNQ